MFIEYQNMSYHSIFKNHKWGDQIIFEADQRRQAAQEKADQDMFEKLKQEKEERKIKFNEMIDKYVRENGKYYFGPLDTYIDIKKHRRIPYLDKRNIVKLFSIGDEISMMRTTATAHETPYTIDEYHDIYCEKKILNGKSIWEYVGRKNN